MITIKRRLIIIVFIAITAAIFLLQKPKLHHRTVYNAFNTVSEISVYSAYDNTAEYEKLLHDLHSQLDVNNKSSLLSKLNNGEKITATPDIINLLATSISYTNMMPEYFDITVNPLVEVWEAAEINGQAPSNIKDALSLVGTNGVHIDVANNTAEITKKGAAITLGAVLKGYVSDVLIDKMRLDGVKSAIVNLGGNVYALGNKPDGSKWQIAIADPNNPASPLLSLNVSDLSVVTSGDYERYYEIDGTRYNHIINPETGYPVDNDLRSVTVIGKDSMLCDILSTAIFVAGKDEAATIAERFGVDVILIDDSSVYITDGVGDIITLSDSNYTLKQLICENR